MGRVTAHALGAAIIGVSALCCGGTDAIVVQVGGSADTLTITVINQNSVVVSNLSLLVGDSAYLDATAANVLGMSLGNVDPTWSSSNPAAASITTTGVVHALAPGSTNIVASYGGVTATVPTTVTTSTPPPPPPPPSSQFTPNEPTGMARQAEYAFSLPSDLHFPGNLGSASGHVDPTAPFSPDQVIRFVYPCCDGTGFGTGLTDTGLPAGTVKVYIAYNWRLSPGFTLHPGNLKAWYFYRTAGGGAGSLVVGYLPTSSNLDTGSFALNGQPQSAGGPALMNPNSSGAPALARNQWFHTEILAVMNTTTGTANGSLKVWVNGSLTLNYTNVVYSDAGSPLEWRAVNLVPYYGGNIPGHTISQTQYLYIDHAVISSSTTR